MIPDQVVSALALIAAGFSIWSQRQTALAFAVGAVFLAWHKMAPNPAAFRDVGYSWFYVAWAAAWLSIYIAARGLRSPGWKPVAYCSLLAFSIMVLTGGFYRFASSSDFILTLYGTAKTVKVFVIPVMEVAVVLSLFLFAWPLVGGLNRVVKRWPSLQVFIQRFSGEETYAASTS